MTPFVARWKTLTEVALPEKAARERWPLRFDHCFKRVTLDNAVGGVWYSAMRRPAEQHLSEQHAEQAVAIAESILAGGRDVLQNLNSRSLQWRRKS